MRLKKEFHTYRIVQYFETQETGGGLGRARLRMRVQNAPTQRLYAENSRHHHTAGQRPVQVSSGKVGRIENIQEMFFRVKVSSWNRDALRLSVLLMSRMLIKI